MPVERRPNALVHEQSPYLQQHAHNPVRWLPWTDEAFALAKEQDRPVFVSIGYATCHWCHVMEHESFEDEDVAAYLNEHFICIKVDREERPDVDAACMDVCQAMTGHGGWPLTIMMDSLRRPFFAGTYFPRESGANRIGFMDLVRRIRAVWDTERERLEHSAGEITTMLKDQAAADLRGDVPADVEDVVVDYHRRMFDDTWGGFSVRPKFPSPHHLLLLMRLARTRHDPSLIDMVRTTLDGMRSGGLFDHVGFGFHRYSTDREWLVPHFEKMLYDQAMLMWANTEAWQATGDDAYRTVVGEIAEYLRREMTSADGDFFCAQDADSEGEEGRFYTWSYDEFRSLVEDDAIVDLMSVHRDGNFHDEATGSATGLNIPHVRMSRLREEVTHTTWPAARHRLYEQRSRRIWPLTDDKVLADWNGLMIASLARAGRAFDDEGLTAMARRAYDAVVRHLGGQDGGEWSHRYRNGHRAVRSMLDDHAAVALAAFELYQTTSDRGYLDDVRLHLDTIERRFSDDGVLYMTDADVHDAIVRQKQGFDSAYPSGNSIAAYVMACYAVLTGDADIERRAIEAVRSHGSYLARMATGYCMLLCTWDLLKHGGHQLSIIGDPSDPFVIEARRIVGRSFLPHVVLNHHRDATGLPQACVMVCTHDSCLAPITSIAELRAWIEEEGV